MVSQEILDQSDKAQMVRISGKLWKLGWSSEGGKLGIQVRDEEGDVQDWYVDDELRKQREEVSRVEEKFRQTKTEGIALQHEAMQLVQEHVASQLMTKGKELEEKEKNGKS